MATEVIRDLASYAEASPSGTGVKIFAFVDRVPKPDANVLVIERVNGSGKNQQIEVYAERPLLHRDRQLA